MYVVTPNQEIIGIEDLNTLGIIKMRLKQISLTLIIFLLTILNSYAGCQTTR